MLCAHGGEIESAIGKGIDIWIVGKGCRENFVCYILRFL